MADSMDSKGIKHTLKRCDEIREKYVKTNNNPFDVDYEPHMIEIRTDDVVNDHISADHATQLADDQKYNIIKFLEDQHKQIVEEKTVIFNVSRLEKDTLLASVLKPTTLRRREDHEHINRLNKRFKAQLV